MDFWKRLKQIIDKEGISISKFEDGIEASRGVIAKSLRQNTDIGSGWLCKIKEKYPQYSMDWLLGEQGQMLCSPSSELRIHDTTSEEYMDFRPKYDDLNAEYIELSKELRESNKELRELHRILDEERKAKQVAEARISQLEMLLATQKKENYPRSASHGDATTLSPSNNR